MNTSEWATIQINPVARSPPDRQPSARVLDKHSRWLVSKGTLWRS